MMSPNVSREYLNIGDGSGFAHGYGYGEGRIGAWVGGGIAFLFLVFLIFGVAAFVHKGHDHTTEVIRDRTNLSAGDIIAAATERGASSARQFNIQALVERIDERVTALSGLVSDIGDRGRCATVESADRIIEVGLQHGFRMNEVVFPDPCRHCRHDRDEERGVSTRVRSA